jgi:hypothetical protein
MKKINIRRIWYQFRLKYLTLNNIVVAIGLMIAAGWVWGSLGVMQRNYSLQKELDDKSRQLILAELDTASAKLQQRYYQTYEYKELAVRERLGLVTPGESVLIFPPNSEAVITAGEVASVSSAVEVEKKSNFWQWIDFLFGNNVKNISK